MLKRVHQKSRYITAAFLDCGNKCDGQAPETQDTSTAPGEHQVYLEVVAAVLAASFCGLVGCGLSAKCVRLVFKDGTWDGHLGRACVSVSEASNGDGSRPSLGHELARETRNGGVWR
jgi:hypothetical protein